MVNNHSPFIKAIVWMAVGLAEVLTAADTLLALSPQHSAPSSVQETMILYAAADTTLNSGSPDSNFGSSATLGLSYSTNRVPVEEGILVRFNLSALPPNAIIDSASFELYLITATGTTPMPVVLNYVKSGWLERTMTWNTALVVEALSLSSSMDDVTQQYKTRAITSWAQYWQANPGENNGLFLRRSTAETGYFTRIFGSREAEGNPPRLVVAYHLPWVCYSLTLSHTGSGADPVPTPGNSTGCAAGNYTAGQSISLLASPAAGWTVAGWIGASNNTATVSNSLVMPAGNHTAGVSYTACYSLTRSHTGAGVDPVATPGNSPGCNPGNYVAGAYIDLNATPSPGWTVSGWTGTNLNSSTFVSNSLNMPAANHSVSVAYKSAVQTIPFDNYADGTNIAEQYAGSGLHFLSDTVSSGPYRSSPRITASSSAHSSPHVLANGYFNLDFYNSANIPMMLWFDYPVNGVGMHLTTIANTQSACTAVSATVKVYDCHGDLIKSSQVNVSALSTTPLEIDDPNGQIYKVVVDYGASTCVEAIDDLAYQPAQSSPCYDTVAPSVAITAPIPGSILTSTSQTFQATILSKGIVKSVKYNGNAMPYYLTSSGEYRISRPVTFQQGANLVVLAAYNFSGNGDNDTALYTVGVPPTPTSVSLKETHLTQRGVIMPKSCDIDTPFVAGKSTLLRIGLDVKSATNAVAYATEVDLMLYRWNVSGNTHIDTIQGTAYPTLPSGGQFTSSSQMSEILFSIPGTDVAQQGSYSFVVQPYFGINPLGSPFTLNCSGSNYQTFQATQPLKVLLVPVEAGAGSPLLQNTSHTAYLLNQLYATARTFPVADFVGPSSGGVRFTQTAPFRMCDGSSTSQQMYPTICLGTGFTWKFIDHDASGILQRADGVTVTDNSQSFCDAKDHTVGGRIKSPALFSYSFNPMLGIFRPGAHPGWQGAKYMIPVDENHDGVIDNTDLGWYIQSFFDSGQNKWLLFPSAWYNLGETIRFFFDGNGNKCNDVSSDTQASIQQKFDNMQAILWKPQEEALNTANNAISGTSNDYTNTILVFPSDLVSSDSQFGDIGLGQGNRPGKLVWNRLRNDTTFSHELGHNLGSLYDRYYDTIPDDIQTTEGASWVYIDGVRWPAYQVYAVMSNPAPYDRGVHAKADYQALFNAIGKPLIQNQALEIDGPVFHVSGAVDSAGQLLSLSSSILTGLAETPIDPAGGYALVFGAGSTELKAIRFAVGLNAPPPEGYSDWPVNLLLFDVISALPDGTQWAELRRAGIVLARLVKTAYAPQVNILSPNGGEDYASNAVMNITWTSSDQDGGNLRHTIEYSPDGGVNWIVAASEVAGNAYPLNLADVPGTNAFSGLVRVTVTDGFNQGQDQSNSTFRVGGKPPLVNISSPAEGQVLLQCGMVRLRGEAFDPEGAALSFQWTVDGLVVGATTQAWAGPPAPGEHLVAFRAEDATGLSRQAQVRIVVLADTDCDGMSNAFEEKYNLNPLAMDDASGDSDQDGLTNLEEYGFGTNPSLRDTDGDGYSDGLEISMGTNPLDPARSPRFKTYLPIIL